MEIFKGHDLRAFAGQFKIDENSKESLAQMMRQEDYRAVHIFPKRIPLIF